MTIEIQLWEGDGVEPKEFVEARLRRERCEAYDRQKRIDIENQRVREWQNVNNQYINIGDDGKEIMTICPDCGRVKPIGEVINRRLNTQYEDEASNWQHSCLDCYEASYELYKDQWAEYYAGQL